jgi:hypothetical protein
MENQDVKTAYETAKSDIASLLGFFECELGKEPKNLNWVHVEELRYIRKSLMETLSFMSGIEVSEIENTLEESRL